MPSLRTLKILVVVMGIMLVGGVAALAVVIAGRLSHGTSPQPIATAPIELPAGAHIETIGVGSERLVLNVVLPDGSRQLLLIDLVTGRRLATIPLHSPPPGAPAASSR